MNNKYNSVIIKTNLVTNFKPFFFENYNNFSFLGKNKNQIFCKNFFVYLLLLKYKKNHFFSKSSIFVKKYKKKVYTILRAPYRHKLARHQFHLNRYEINSSIKIPLKNPFFTNKWNNIINILNFLKSFNKIFESNIIFITSVNVKVPFKYNQNFFIKNFIKNK